MKINNPFENIDRRRATLFAFFLAISAFVFFIASYFNVDMNSVTTALFVIVLSLLVFLTWSVAGIVVFRALFFVGASLTFMIFIAQTYCAVPEAARTADDALQTLFGFGLLYVGVAFFNSLYKELTQSLSHLEKVYDGKKPWLIVILFGLFVGLFVWQLFQVMNPIIQDLCIYS